MSHLRSKVRFISLVVATMLAVMLVPVTPAAANTMIPQPAIASGDAPRGLAIGDVDGDGTDDVVTADFRQGAVSVYLQSAVGVLDPRIDVSINALNPRFPNATPASIQLGDVAGDATKEILVGDTYYQVIHVLQYNGLLATPWQLIFSIPTFQGVGTMGGPVSNPFDFSLGLATTNVFGPGLDGRADLLIPKFYNVPVGGGNGAPSNGGGFLFLEQLPHSGAPGWGNLRGIAMVPPANGLAAKGVVTVPGSGFLSTQSNGEFWAETTPRVLDPYLYQLWDVAMTNERDGLAAAGAGQVLVTHNGGFDWLPMSVTANGRMYGVYLNGERGWAVGDGGDIRRLEDEAWSSVENTITTNTLFDVDAATDVPAIAVGAGGTVLVISSNRDSWKVTAGTGAPAVNLNALDIAGRAHLVGDGGWVSYSDDYGDSWTNTQIVPGTDLNDVAFVDYFHGWVVGDGGVIYRTEDAGMTWDVLVSGTAENLNGVSFVSDLEGWSVGDSGTILYTSDGGDNWTVVGDDAGSWTAWEQTYTSTFNPYSAAIADLSGDGFPDLAVGGYLSGSIAPYYQTGHGLASWPYYRYWTNAPNDVGMISSLYDIAAGDLNGDSLNDLAGVMYAPPSSEGVTKGKLAIATQNGINWLSGSAPYVLDAGIAPSSVLIADVNQDGQGDVIVANNYNSGYNSGAPGWDKGSVGIFLSKSPTDDSAGGPVEPMREYMVGRQPSAVAVGNLDADPELEIVVTNTQDDTIQVLDYGTPIAPRITSSTHPDQTAWYNARLGRFTFVDPPDFDGIQGYRYVVDQLPSTVPTSGSAPTVQRDVGISFPADGTWYVHAVSFDADNNLGAEAAHFRVNIDTGAPTAPSVDDGVSGWTLNSDRTFTWTPSTDARSGLDRYFFRIGNSAEDSTTLTTTSIPDMPEGHSVFRVRARDRAGNFSAYSTHDVYVDLTGPSASVTAPAKDNDWVHGTYTFTANAADAAAVESVDFRINGTLVATDYTAPYSVSYNTVGLPPASTLTVVAHDMGGRTATATRALRVDNSVPAISSISDTPDPFYPIKRDGYKDNLSIKFRLSERATVKVQIYKRTSLYRTITASKSAGYNTISWNGKSSSGGGPSVGTYYYRIVATDAAGNTRYSAKYPTTVKLYVLQRNSNGSITLVAH